MVEIVNIVGTGSLDRELDLKRVEEDIDVHYSNYLASPEGLYIKFQEDSPTIVISNTGKYTISGASDLQTIKEVQKKLFSEIRRLGIKSIDEDPNFQIKNVVGVANLNSDLNLNSLVIELGLENSEYEPEQFPGIVYRPPGESSTILIFSSGKVVITGVLSKAEAKESFDILKNSIKNIINAGD